MSESANEHTTMSVNLNPEDRCRVNKMEDTNKPLPNTKKTSALGVPPDTVKSDDTLKIATLATDRKKAPESLYERVKEHRELSVRSHEVDPEHVMVTSNTDRGNKKLRKDTVKRSDTLDHTSHTHDEIPSFDHMSRGNVMVDPVVKASKTHKNSPDTNDDKDSRPECTKVTRFEAGRILNAKEHK